MPEGTDSRRRTLPDSRARSRRLDFSPIRCRSSGLRWSRCGWGCGSCHHAGPSSASPSYTREGCAPASRPVTTMSRPITVFGLAACRRAPGPCTSMTSGTLLVAGSWRHDQLEGDSRPTQGPAWPADPLPPPSSQPPQGSKSRPCPGRTGLPQSRDGSSQAEPSPPRVLQLLAALGRWCAARQRQLTVAGDPNTSHTENYAAAATRVSHGLSERRLAAQGRDAERQDRPPGVRADPGRDLRRDRGGHAAVPPSLYAGGTRG